MSSEETIDHRGAIHIKCPHCHNPIELVAETPGQELLCPSCGSSFHLDADRTQTWTKDKLPTLGQFELIEAVGRGAFGTVYKARDTLLQRIVAVKVPRSGQLLTDDDEDRFVREARNAAQLQHAGIVPVFEVGHSDTFPYIVSEFVEGITLADALTARKFSFRESARLVAQVAAAIQHAHHHGVVHRDLKPSNIMITTDGEPRVMDFGLAKRDAGEITMTVEGQVLGTPAYMSPEQASGQGHHVDGRSDVYSLGVILFELITGELPFRGNQRMLLNQVLHDEPRSPRSLNDRIPRDLETICLKAMSKEAGRRYQSAQALAEDLGRWSANKPIDARPIGRLGRAMRWVKRNPVPAVLSAALFMALLTGSFVSFLYALRANEMRGVAEAGFRAEQQARTETETERQRSEEQKRQAENLLYASQTLRASELWNAGYCAPARAVLDGSQLNLRGWEHDFLNSMFTQERHVLKGQSEGIVGMIITSVAFSPDGLSIASSAADKTITIWDASTGARRLVLTGHTEPRIKVAFSPDSKSVVSGCNDKTLRVWDAGNGKELLVIKDHPGAVTSIAVSPDGLRLASGSDDGRVRLWDARDASLKLTLEGHSAEVTSVAFSPDGRRIGSGSADKTARVWNSENGQQLATMQGHSAIVNSVAFSHTGSQLASGSGDATVRIWDTDNGNELAKLIGHLKYVWAVAFSPDDNQVASAGEDLTVRIWDTQSGIEITALRGHEQRTQMLYGAPDAGVQCVAFSADGHNLVTGGDDNLVRVWKPVSTRLLPGVPGSVSRLAFSPDGRRIATGLSNLQDNRAIKIWDAQTGLQLVSIDSHSRRIRGLAFSPDGKKIAARLDNNTIIICDSNSGKETASFKGLAASGFSPDSQRIAVGVDAIGIYDVESGKELAKLGKPGAFVRSVTFSPDGRRVASCAVDKSATVWDVSSQKALLNLGEVDFEEIVFSPDGKRIASRYPEASENKTLVTIWDAASGTQIARLKGHVKPVFSLAYSPDGGRIATGDLADTVKIWDAGTGIEVLTLKAGLITLWTLAFSPDGHQLAGGGMARAVRFWNADCGKEIPSATGEGGAGRRPARPPVDAPEGTAVTRRQWKGGNSRFVKQDELKWTEIEASTGKVLFEFVEKERNTDSIELYDVSRDLWILLQDDSAQIMVGKDGAFQEFLRGLWID